MSYVNGVTHKPVDYSCDKFLSALQSVDSLDLSSIESRIVYFIVASNMLRAGSVTFCELTRALTNVDVDCLDKDTVERHVRYGVKHLISIGLIGCEATIDDKEDLFYAKCDAISEWAFKIVCLAER